MATCKTLHCDRKAHAKGYCAKCYTRLFSGPKSYAKKRLDPAFKEQQAAKQRLRREAGRISRDPFAERSRALRKRYGLSWPDFLHMLERQAGMCAVCCRPLRPGRGTQVDHDHQTGRVRGLLCISCNLLVGRLEEKLAEDAMRYIQAGRHAGAG